MTALNFPASPSNGDVYENYQYDGTDGVWKRLPSSSLGINGLADVTITTPADGESLVYDNATGEWINADATVEVYGVDTAATDYFMIPVGGDSDRPVAPANGHIRFNSDSGEPEYYSEAESSWFLFRQEASLFPVSAEYVVVAGGGGGGVSGGGGGAGGYRSNVAGESSGGGASAESALSLSAGTHTITVGAGGAGSNSTAGAQGAASVFSLVSTVGGGGGGSVNQGNAGSGGSGGGASRASVSVFSGGSGTTGEGFAGGGNDDAAPYPSGGGGGAGAVGGAGNSGTTLSGNGGVGVYSSITGTPVGRAGGGGGGGEHSSGNPKGFGGSGGGGDGGFFINEIGDPGVTNTGGGGGGSAGGNGFGGTGGSGVVIFKLPNWTNVTFSVGLTEANGGAGQTVGDYKVYTVTAGTGAVTIS